MYRVLVIGSGGAGKSTFSARLAALTGLPLIHLDALYWKPGWVEPSKDEWHATLARVTAEPRWILDGNYGGSLDQRLAACDTVVFLDTAPWRCLWRVLMRRLRHRGRTRPDMTPGCPERLTLDFLWWIARYPLERRPRVLRTLAALRDGQRVVRLRSPAEVERWLQAAALT